MSSQHIVSSWECEVIDYERPWVVIIDRISRKCRVLRRDKTEPLPDPIRQIHAQKPGKRIPDYWED